MKIIKGTDRWIFTKMLFFTNLLMIIIFVVRFKQVKDSFWFGMQLINAALILHLMYIRNIEEIKITSDGCHIKYWRFLRRREVFIEMGKFYYSYKEDLISQGIFAMAFAIYKEDGRRFAKLTNGNSLFRHDEIMEVIQAFKEAGVKEI